MSDGQLAGRLLIAWDYAASGIWTVSGSSGRAATYELGAELTARIQEWNNQGERLDACPAPFPAEFWSEARALASAVQQRLGAGWEVLYQDPTGAWTWVQAPRSWGR